MTSQKDFEREGRRGTMSCENCANAYDEGYTAGRNAENARLREQADALADALGGVTYSGPICFPEDGGRCHWCEGKEAHGHADHCDWIRGDAALRTYLGARHE